VEQEPSAVLACEWSKRPKGAPTFGDLAGSLRSVRRADGELLVEYDPCEAERLAELIAAERLCCAQIGWRVDRATVRITAAPEQLDVLEQVVRTP
jgi:hypothetical protein